MSIIKNYKITIELEKEYLLEIITKTVNWEEVEEGYQNDDYLRYVKLMSSPELVKKFVEQVNDYISNKLSDNELKLNFQDPDVGKDSFLQLAIEDYYQFYIRTVR